MPQEKNILVNRGIPRKPSSPFGFGFGAGGASGPDHSDRGYDLMDSATDWLNDNNAYTEELFNENIKNIIHITDAELAKTRAAVAAVVPPGTDALEIELRTLKLQLFKARTDHQEQIGIANLYYGHDPLTKGFEAPPGRRSGQMGYYRAVEKWNISYAAAYEAKFLAEKIKLLDARLATQNNAIADTNAKAAAAAQARAQAEARRVAEEQARMAAEEANRVAAIQAEQHRQQAIAEAARRQKEQEEIQAREQARIAALAEAQRLAAVRARLAAEAAARQVAAEQARLAALAEQQRQAERRRIEAERQEREKKQAIAEVHHVYPASGAAAASSPVFAFASTTITLAPAGSAAILTALRSALQLVAMAGAAMAGPVLMGFAALLTPSRLGNGERFVMSVPLAELSSETPQSLRSIADRQGVLDLPLGLGHRPIGSGAEVFVVTANDFDIRLGVPVLHATYDLLNDVYETVLPDSPTDFLTWTPAITPSDNSTELPIVQTHTPAYSGTPIVPIEGRLDLHPILVEGWDRFIIVFPDDAGIAPLYVVISSPYQGASVKGKYSGRLFNPEQAGGPILDLDWRTAVITQTGIDAVKLHIARLDQSDANDMMVQRLEKILNGYLQLTDTDLRYYTHEMRELERFRALGLSDDFKPDKDLPIWNNAHTATLEDFKLQDDESLLYTEDAIAAADRQDEVFFKNFLKGGKQ